MRWDAAYTDPHTGSVGRAYLDLDTSEYGRSANDFIMSWRIPVIFGKRSYSVALTQALLDTGALTASTWPADLATPEEAARDWPFRQSPGRYVDLRTMMPGLKVMLVFAQTDHAQALPDKPHIHQAYQGFRFEAGLWVRLNPDRAYVQALLPAARNDFPDNPADTQGRPTGCRSGITPIPAKDLQRNGFPWLLPLKWPTVLILAAGMKTWARCFIFISRPPRTRKSISTGDHWFWLLNLVEISWVVNWGQANPIPSQILRRGLRLEKSE